MAIPNPAARMRRWRTARKISRRRRRQIRERRLGALARATTPPPAPPTWRAGWTGRVLAIMWCVQFLWFTVRPAVAEAARATLGDWISLLMVSLVATWIGCRLGMWRVTAGHSGVWIRRFWTVAFLPWHGISHVDMRRDGLLEFFGERRRPMAGLYGPPRLNQILGRPDAGQQVADLLTLMARHPHLRPATDPDRQLRGRAFAVWAPMAIGIIALSSLIP